jgi:membrane protease YdiL (CAAX protease family)
LRRHPLIAYFVLANGLSWLTLLILGRLLNLPASIVVGVFTLGPTAAAVIVTSVVDGPSGLRQLLNQVVRWRVGLQWYVVALLGIPLVILLATLVLPGALASFHPMSPVRWLVTYVIVFVVGGVAGGPLFEEPGWRGFALPRMQAQLGPLGGTLLLGVLWAGWHLPQYFVVSEWVAQNGGQDAVNIAIFVLTVLALAPIMTWLFNHTRGSVLLAMLAHASVNTAQVALVSPLFPSAANESTNLLLAFAVASLVLIVVTRGRLGYPSESIETPATNAATPEPAFHPHPR